VEGGVGLDAAALPAAARAPAPGGDALDGLDGLDELAGLDAPLTVEGLAQECFPRWEDAWFGRVISEAVTGAVRWSLGLPGGVQGVAISLPPQHRKTTYSSVLAPALGFGLSPDLRVMGLTADGPLAKRNIHDTSAIMRSAPYLARFAARVGKVEVAAPGQGRRRVAQAESVKNFFRLLDRTGCERRGYYLSQGMDGGKIGWAYDLGVCDDPCPDMRSAASQADKRHREETYDAVFEGRKSATGAQIITFHRWSDDDLFEYVLRKWRASSTPHVVRRFPAIQDDGADREAYDPRADGESLRFLGRGDAHYERMRAAISATRPWIWETQYQQRPRPPGGGLVRRDWWREYDPEALKHLELDGPWLAVDGNLVEGGASMAAAEVWAGLSGQPDMYKLAERRGSWSYADFKAEVRGLLDEWPEIRQAVCERTVSGAALASDLQGEGGVYWEPWQADLHLSPEARVNLMLEIVKAGRLHVPARMYGRITPAWVESHLREWTRFPRGKPDDRVSAGGLICRWRWVRMGLIKIPRGKAERSTDESGGAVAG
jgi:hypothetical protein